MYESDEEDWVDDDQPGLQPCVEQLDRLMSLDHRISSTQYRLEQIAHLRYYQGVFRPGDKCLHCVYFASRQESVPENLRHVDRRYERWDRLAQHICEEHLHTAPRWSCDNKEAQPCPYTRMRVKPFFTPWCGLMFQDLMSFGEASKNGHKRDQKVIAQMAAVAKDLSKSKQCRFTFNPTAPVGCYMRNPLDVLHVPQQHHILAVCVYGDTTFRECNWLAIQRWRIHH